MKIRALLNKYSSKGFTLIELLLVIAIIGVMATVLITTIDPLDKIALTNDTGVISDITQLGKANDSYAAQHSNGYTSGQGTFPASVCTPGSTTAAVGTNSFAGALYDLCAAGEIKMSSIAPPSSAYTFYYFVTPVGCTDSSNGCTGAQFAAGPLQAKKYQTPGVGKNQYYVYSNGKSCVTTTPPTQGNIPLCQ